MKKKIIIIIIALILLSGCSIKEKDEKKKTKEIYAQISNNICENQNYRNFVGGSCLCWWTVRLPYLIDTINYRLYYIYFRSLLYE